MNRPDDFNDRDRQKPEAEGSVGTEHRDQEIPPVGIDIFSQQSGSATQWYGVSYQSGAEQPTVARRSKKGKIALIAVWVVVLVMISAVAGYAGAMLYSSFNDAPLTDLPGDGASGPGGSSSDSSGLGLGEEIFGNEGNEGYAYGEVTLYKNDGSSLIGSVTGSVGSNAMSKIDVVAAVKASVVEITTTTVSNYGSIAAGAGSGVIIHADGIIVTNNHVIAGAERVYVRLTNGNTYEATVRGTDEDGDIAVIKIDPRETLTVARLGYSGALVEGEEVIAIGNPLGELGGTVTDGIISQVEREISVDGVNMTLLQTNAAINSGNSGGGLFNMAGELIGVVNAKYSATGVEGLGFAIPIDTAMISIRHLLDVGYIPDIPSLGITLAEGTVRNGYLSYRQVVYVYDAGENEDFAYKDIFVSVAGVSVSSLSELKQVVRSHKVGDTVTVVVLRDNREVSVQVTLVEYVPDTAA